LFPRIFGSGPAPTLEPPGQTSAQARRWTRRLRWLAWLLPIALSLSIYIFVWQRVALGLPESDVQQANNLLLYGLLASTGLGIFIYQVQIILARQVAASVELERRVEERTRHLTQALEQLDHQNQALLALDKQKSEFVTLVSHELRAPLTNINSGLELLLKQEYGLAPPVRDALELVAAEGQRLTHFVESILDVSAFEAGQLPMAPGPASMAAAIQRVTGQFAPKLAAGRLTTQVAPDLPAAQGDERYLQSVVFHLVDNALKYAPGAPVTVAAQSDGNGWIEMRVTDGGPGLPPEAAARLFTKFERLNARDSQAVYGHGLGLYMCRRIVEACHGEISVESVVGQGTTFAVRLPVWQEAA
jgi:signal transduction histidine kinase